MTAFLQYRFVFVVALLAGAAVLVTDRNRLPVVLRGLRRTLGGSSTPPSENVPVSRSRRLLALVLVRPVPVLVLPVLLIPVLVHQPDLH